jgi:hypothetical protein
MADRQVTEGERDLTSFYAKGRARDLRGFSEIGIY